MKCLICGKNFKYLKTHLTKKHKITYQEYFHNYLHNPVKECLVCGQPALWHTKSYYDYCSVKCMHILRSGKNKATCLKKYGVECSLNTPESIAKKKQTWLIHLGVDNPSKSHEVKQTKERTCLANHGVSNILKKAGVRALGNPYSAEALQKKRDTCKKRHGIPYPMQNPEILKKAQDTNKKNTTIFALFTAPNKKRKYKKLGMKITELIIQVKIQTLSKN